MWKNKLPKRFFPFLPRENLYDKAFFEHGIWKKEDGKVFFKYRIGKRQDRKSFFEYRISEKEYSKLQIVRSLRELKIYLKTEGEKKNAGKQQRLVAKYKTRAAGNGKKVGQGV
ncbi:MAG: hypothetical protein FWB99_05505 [Treponema sp.]|nr:hypothetical protein [Treponema sp.]